MPPPNEASVAACLCRVCGVLEANKVRLRLVDCDGDLPRLPAELSGDEVGDVPYSGMWRQVERPRDGRMTPNLSHRGRDGRSWRQRLSLPPALCGGHQLPWLVRRSGGLLSAWQWWWRWRRRTLVVELLRPWTLTCWRVGVAGSRRSQ